MLASIQIFVIFLLIRVHIRAELISAITDINKLMATHKKVTKDLNTYVTDEKRRLEILKAHLERFKVEHANAMKNVSKYLANPINCFTLIKRLTLDLEYIQKNIQERSVYRRSHLVSFPSKEDVQGIGVAIAQLQFIYNLNVTAIADGVFTGNFSHGYQSYTEKMLPMSSSDCFEMGRALYAANVFTGGVKWFREALARYRAEDQHAFTENHILEFISFAEMAEGDLDKAIVTIKKVLVTTEPNSEIHKRALKTLSFYQELLEKKINMKSGAEKQDANSTENLDDDAKQQWIEGSKAFPNASETERFGSLCRGEISVPQKILKRLKCHYLTAAHPFLRLAPVKIEQLYLKPSIKLVYDVMTVDEITAFKLMAIPSLEEAKVTHPSGTIIPDPDCTCTLAVLRYETDLMQQVARRIGHFTGFGETPASPFHVVNYPLGGFYNPHFDYPPANVDHAPVQHETRLATVIFYMSDIALGGATVFPSLGVTVFPVKGAALLWNNMMPSGYEDRRTKHAGCPILRGNKWITRRWLYGQTQTCKIHKRRAPQTVPETPETTTLSIGPITQTQ